jgi:hypothetical protein
MMAKQSPAAEAAQRRAGGALHLEERKSDWFARWREERSEDAEANV